jgi:hypothetical protein
MILALTPLSGGRAHAMPIRTFQLSALAYDPGLGILTTLLTRVGRAHGSGTHAGFEARLRRLLARARRRARA